MILLVLTRGQQGPDYRNKKDPAAGPHWKSRDEKVRKELEHTGRKCVRHLKQTQALCKFL